MTDRPQVPTVTSLAANGGYAPIIAKTTAQRSAARPGAKWRLPYPSLFIRVTTGNFSPYCGGRRFDEQSEEGRDPEPPPLLAGQRAR